MNVARAVGSGYVALARGALKSPRSQRMAIHRRAGVYRIAWKPLGAALAGLVGCTPLADADAVGASPRGTDPVRDEAPGARQEPPPAGTGEPEAEAPSAPNGAAEQPPPEPAGAAIPLDMGPVTGGSGALGSDAGPTAPLTDAGVSELDRCPGAERFRDSCYRAVLVSRPWNAARADCRANGGDLVVIDDGSEDAFVGGLVEGNVWLGASDQASQDQFEWVDGSGVVFANWAPGQPDAFPEPDCVQKREEQGEPWYDQPCSSSNLYVCESAVTP